MCTSIYTILSLQGSPAAGRTASGGTAPRRPPSSAAPSASRWVGGRACTFHRCPTGVHTLAHGSCFTCEAESGTQQLWSSRARWAEQASSRANRSPKRPHTRTYTCEHTHVHMLTHSPRRPCARQAWWGCPASGCRPPPSWSPTRGRCKRAGGVVCCGIRAHMCSAHDTPPLESPPARTPPPVSSPPSKPPAMLTRGSPAPCWWGHSRPP